MSYCIDTCILLEYLVLRFIADSGGSGQELDQVTLQGPGCDLVVSLKPPTARRAFSTFLKKRPRFFTTSGVTVEVARHIRGADRFNNPVFWNVAHRVYRELGLDEHLVLLEECGAQHIARIGLVDESLIVVCLRTGMTLLTADRRTLQPRARQAQVSVLDIDELIATHT